MTLFATDDILPEPPPDALEVLHDREYRVRAFQIADDRLLIQGAVRDQKPPGLYVPDDPEPLTIHHMQLSFEVGFPSLEIVAATVHFESHPHPTCPSIETHYEQLVGLSIARGFTHKVRGLFGGPRGCTHTTALLQAMAPVAVQCFWSMRAATAKRAGVDNPVVSRERTGSGDGNLAYVINSCHVWADDGPALAERRAGGGPAVPIPMQRRLDELGIETPVDFDG